MITCNDCISYKPKAHTNYSLGKCTFPLPYWLLYGTPGGGFVDNSTEIDCMCFSPREQDKKDDKQ